MTYAESIARNAIKAATDGAGLIDFLKVEDEVLVYVKDTDEAFEAVDVALAEMEADGTVRYENSDYYIAEERDEYLAAMEDATEDAEQARIDAWMGYSLACDL